MKGLGRRAGAGVWLERGQASAEPEPGLILSVRAQGGPAGEQGSDVRDTLEMCSWK